MGAGLGLEIQSELQGGVGEFHGLGLSCVPPFLSLSPG